MIDNDCDGLIDCADPDCAHPPCPLIRSDPSWIRFGPPGVGLDVLRSSGYVNLTGSVDLSRMRVGWLVSTSRGIVYEGVLEPGDLQVVASNRNVFVFEDLGAPQGQSLRDGIYKAKLIITSHRVRYRLQAYGDMATAAATDMSVQFYVGEVPFMVSGVWQPTATGAGWSLRGHHGAGFKP